MRTDADKAQDGKIQSIANERPQKQSSSESTFQFVDNRPEAIGQRKLQAMAMNRPQEKRVQIATDLDGAMLTWRKWQKELPISSLTQREADSTMQLSI